MWVWVWLCVSVSVSVSVSVWDNVLAEMCVCWSIWVTWLEVSFSLFELLNHWAFSRQTDKNCNCLAIMWLSVCGCVEEIPWVMLASPSDVWQEANVPQAICSPAQLACHPATTEHHWFHTTCQSKHLPSVPQKTNQIVVYRHHYCWALLFKWAVLCQNKL